MSATAFVEAQKAYAEMTREEIAINELNVGGSEKVVPPVYQEPSKNAPVVNKN